MTSRKRKGPNNLSFKRTFLVAAIATPLAVSAAYAFAGTKCGKQGETRAGLLSMRSAALLWQADHAGCPTLRDLVSHQYVDDRGSLDAWGTPFQFSCKQAEVFVTSAGPDKRYDTEDDLRVSETHVDTL